MRAWSFASSDIQPEVEIRTAAGNRDCLIERSRSAVDAVNDHVGNAAVRISPGAARDLSGHYPRCGAAFKAGITDYVGAGPSRAALVTVNV